MIMTDLIIYGTIITKSHFFGFILYHGVLLYQIILLFFSFFYIATVHCTRTACSSYLLFSLSSSLSNPKFFVFTFKKQKRNPKSFVLPFKSKPEFFRD